jgi:hypothetical protein
MSLSYKTLGMEDVLFFLNLTRNADSATPSSFTKKMISSHSVRLG